MSSSSTVSQVVLQAKQEALKQDIGTELGRMGKKEITGEEFSRRRTALEGAYNVWYAGFEKNRGATPEETKQVRQSYAAQQADVTEATAAQLLQAVVSGEISPSKYESQIKYLERGHSTRVGQILGGTYDRFHYGSPIAYRTTFRNPTEEEINRQGYAEAEIKNKEDGLNWSYNPNTNMLFRPPTEKEIDTHGYAEAARLADEEKLDWSYDPFEDRLIRPPTELEIDAHGFSEAERRRREEGLDWKYNPDLNQLFREPSEEEIDLFGISEAKRLTKEEGLEHTYDAELNQLFREPTEKEKDKQGFQQAYDLTQEHGHLFTYNPDTNMLFETSSKKIDPIGFGKGWGGGGDGGHALNTPLIPVQSLSEKMLDWYTEEIKLVETGESKNWSALPDEYRQDVLDTLRRGQISTAAIGEVETVLLGPLKFGAKILPGKQLFENLSVVSKKTIEGSLDLTVEERRELTLGVGLAGVSSTLIRDYPLGMAVGMGVSGAGSLFSKAGEFTGKLFEPIISRTPELIKKVVGLPSAGLSFLGRHPNLIRAGVWSGFLGLEGIKVAPRIMGGESLWHVAEDVFIDVAKMGASDYAFSKGYSTEFPIKRGKVDIPLEEGGWANWKGFYLTQGDDVSRLTGKISLYDDSGILIQELDDIGIEGLGGIKKNVGSTKGYMPETKIQSKITTDTMKLLGYGDNQLLLVDDVLGVISKTENVASKFIDDFLPSETGTLGEDGTLIVKKFFKENVDEIDKLYGSYATRSQLNEAYEFALEGKSALRLPGDFDVSVKGSADDVMDFSSRLLDDLLEGGQKVRIDPSKPNMIEAFVGGEKGWAHAVDIHGLGDELGATPTGLAWGFELDKGSLFIEDLPVQTLADQGIKKGKELLGFKDDFTLGPLDHRTKDIPDFVQVQQTLIDSGSLGASSPQDMLNRVRDHFGVEDLLDISEDSVDFVTVSLKFKTDEVSHVLGSQSYLGSLILSSPGSSLGSTGSLLESDPVSSSDSLLGSPSSPVSEAGSVLDLSIPPSMFYSSPVSPRSLSYMVGIPSVFSSLVSLASSKRPVSSPSILDISSPFSSSPSSPRKASPLSVSSPSILDISSPLSSSSPSSTPASSILSSPPSLPPSSPSYDPYDSEDSSDDSSPSLGPFLGFPSPPQKGSKGAYDPLFGWEDRKYPIPTIEELIGWEPKKTKYTEPEDMFSSGSNKKLNSTLDTLLGVKPSKSKRSKGLDRLLEPGRRRRGSSSILDVKPPKGFDDLLFGKKKRTRRAPAKKTSKRKPAKKKTRRKRRKKDPFAGFLL